MFATTSRTGQLETHPVDVLVIGAGGAGLRAAIAAHEAGATVALVCKSLLGKAHTVMAEGGVAAAMGHVASSDSWQIHFRDTMVGGKYLNNPRMAELHAQEAPARVRELEAWGAVFDRTRDGRILQRPFGGHSHPRLAHVGDRTGLEMIRTLQDRAVSLGIDVYMECTITRLITGPKGVTGAFGYWRTTGEPILFPAKATVIATGGIGKAYEVTSNSWEYSGDGHALAFDAGAELIDMEFVQFHPTGMVWPPGVRGLLVTEAVRGEGGILRNKDGERFMWKYLPEERRQEYAADDAEAARWVTALSQGRESKDARRPPELSTRDNVSRAIYTEVREGRGSPHGGVFLDISYLPADHVRRKLPSMYDQFKELADVDITKGPMEIAPTTHYVMGGIRVDAETGASTVPGLFSAGEASGGMHGANRLGGNSLSDLLVFGARTGAGAAAHAAGQAAPYIDPVQVEQASRELAAPLERSGEDPYAVQRDLQAAMQSLVGIFRVDADLATALDRIAEVRSRWQGIGVKGGRAYNPGWNLVFELRNLITVSEAITRSARQRTESRGAHSRIDYSQTDDASWGHRNSVVRRRKDGSMEVATTRLPQMAGELETLLGAH
ncbi:MAG TPA: fumarate reductase/succinate dehydrogenase flavoprotein subunit [Candidatus Limnocylindrales bacterium]|nr:fumarate reductase/succinate dehydrogenase flavoprotein subunit [Candidatus Limnocylindrales bacterium]